MKRKALIAVSILTTAMSTCGCVTTHSTKGFQTNPPVRAGVGSPQNNTEPKGIRKLFAGWNSGQQKQTPPVEAQSSVRNDATSLQAPATVSADLLIVAGEMGLEQQRFDLAKSYFERALKIDPNNMRAKAGLSRAASGRPSQVPVSNAKQIEIQNRTQQLINSFGKKSPPVQSESGIRLVSFIDDSDVVDVEPSEEARPESISVEQLAEYRRTDMTMSPAISVKRERGSISQRVANPHFSSYGNYFATKSSRAKKKRTFKIKPAKVQFEKTRSLSDDKI